jgi:DNA-binding beta-propeller fold protein YncE
VVYGEPGEIRVSAVINGKTGYARISVSPAAPATVDVAAPKALVVGGSEVLARDREKRERGSSAKRTYDLAETPSTVRILRGGYEAHHGPGVYNLAISKDGKMLATNKRGQSVSIFELSSGRELVRLQTKRKVPDGVVVTPDGRYALVAVEGIGSEPGTVEVIDLHSLKTVATVDVPEQAVGTDFWKVESATAPR